MAFDQAPTDFFRSGFQKLRKKKDLEVKAILLKKWEDMRLAIDFCWNSGYQPSFFPYAVSSASIANLYRTLQGHSTAQECQ
jgi:hypothetical protein